MRSVVFLAFVLFANALHAQDEFFSGPAIEAGAFRAKLEEARAEVKVKDRLIADLRSIVHDFEAKLAAVKSCDCTCNCGKQAAAQQPVSQWKITMQTIPDCDSCKDAKATQPQLYMAANWQWETVDLKQPEPGHSYPRYVICDGKTCSSIECHPSEFDSRLRALMANWNQQQSQPLFGKRFK